MLARQKGDFWSLPSSLPLDGFSVDVDVRAMIASAYIRQLRSG
jgi:hypothetical protein